MAKINLASMSVETLLDLRDDVGRALTRRAGDLRRQLAALGEDVSARGRRPGRVSKMKGRMVPPKYRNPKNRSETWAGRGAMPKWMATEIDAGKKQADFLIQQPATKATNSPAKRRRKKK
jgi:DNA-binding protein H-NS